MYRTATQKFISYPSNVLSYDKQRPATSKERTPRGSFIIKRISTSPTYTSGLDVGHTTMPGVSDKTIYVDVQITEPLLMSPFIFGPPENKQGFYGITNMNFQMNMAPNANRAWRSVKFTTAAGTLKNAYVQSVQNSELKFTFLTGHPTDQLPSRNIVPYYELPIYRTTGSFDVQKTDFIS